MERTRWGNISTSVDRQTGAVTQSGVRGGQITDEKFGSIGIADTVLAERQKEDLRASRKLGFISKLSPAITILSQIKSIKDDGRFNMETALVGGFTAAVSPPLQIVFWTVQA